MHPTSILPLLLLYSHLKKSFLSLYLALLTINKHPSYIPPPSSTASTQQALENSNKTSDQKIAEKDLIIEDQTVKMSYMSTEFEQMLNDTLSKMTKKLETVSLKWKETEGVKMSDSSQKKLADFQIMRNLMTTS